MRVQSIGIHKIAEQMQAVLIGKTVESLKVNQKKALNVTEEVYNQRTKGAMITEIRIHGKWLIIALDNSEYLLLSFSLGNDIFYFENRKIKKIKYPHNVEVNFTDGSGFTARFWWFEKFYLLNFTDLAEITEEQNGTIDPLDDEFSLDYFISLLTGKKSQIKSFLMSQNKISGLSGMYMHDILWGAGVHPAKKISDLSGNEIKKLYANMIEKVTFFRSHMDFFDETKAFVGDDFFIAYLDNEEPCPTCGASIQYIKTGSTSTYICPTCQKL